MTNLIFIALMIILTVIHIVGDWAMPTFSIVSSYLAAGFMWTATLIIDGGNK